MICLARVMKLAYLGPRVSLVIGVKAIESDGGEDDGGDETILMTLAGGNRSGCGSN